MSTQITTTKGHPYPQHRIDPLLNIVRHLRCALANFCAAVQSLYHGIRMLRLSHLEETFRMVPMLASKTDNGCASEGRHWLVCGDVDVITPPITAKVKTDGIRFSVHRRLNKISCDVVADWCMNCGATERSYTSLKDQ